MRHGFALFWIALAVLCLWVLESARSGVQITRDMLGDTPVIHYQTAPGGPQVVIAHGFAGSAQIMQSYALHLAQAGYTVTAFDFEGHGRNRVPMSGDVTSVDGTTQRLVDQSLKVIDAVAQDGPVALLGHSMASDVLVRVAQRSDKVGPIALLSAFSLEITPDHPSNLLLIAGAGEGRLKDFALEAARMVNPEAAYFETVTNAGVVRRAEVAPWVEHVAILHSRAGRQAVTTWFNDAYGRTALPPTPVTGLALLGMMFAVIALFAPVVARLPATAPAAPPLSGKQIAVVCALPMLIAPLVSVLVYRPVLPVLVADYIALHLLVFALVQGAVLWRFRTRPGRLNTLALGLVLVWTLGIFGLLLNRYGTNFWPTPDRMGLIAALALGAVPYMVCDALLSQGGSRWPRIAARAALLVSLIGAVALAPERLFFVLMIAPVILLFYLVFGPMARRTTLRAGPLAPGIGLGITLAWALGVSFPLFAS